MRTQRQEKKERVEFERSCGNVFADLGLPNADELLVRAKLVSHINSLIDQRGVTRPKAARMLGVATGELRELLRGDLELFPMYQLFRFLNALDQDVEIRVRPKARGNAFARTTVTIGVVHE